MRGEYFRAHGKINGRDDRADADKVKRTRKAVDPAPPVKHREPTAQEAAETWKRIEERKLWLASQPAPIVIGGDLMRIIDAAAAVGITAESLRSWIKRDDCPVAGYIGARAVVSVSELREYLAKREAETQRVRSKKKRERLAAEADQRRRDGQTREEYFSAYYAKKRAELLKARREYYAKNRDKILKTHKAYRDRKKTS